MATGLYNWEKLKGDFKRGEVSTVQEFLRVNNIKFSGYVAKKTTGWVGERAEYKKEMEKRKDERTIEAESESEAQIRARQAKIARAVQAKGLKALTEVDANGNPLHPVENVDQARRLIIDGLKEERSALDMDKKIISSGNVNIAILNTRYGETLKNLGNGQLSELIEGLRKLDSGGKNTIAGGGDIPEGEITG